MKKGNAIAIIGFLVVLNVMLLWCIDVSVTGIAEETKMSVMDAYGIDYIVINSDVGMTNGFIRVTPNQMYHLCLYTMIATNFLFFLFFVHEKLE